MPTYLKNKERKASRLRTLIILRWPRRSPAPPRFHTWEERSFGESEPCIKRKDRLLPTEHPNAMPAEAAEGKSGGLWTGERSAVPFTCQASACACAEALAIATNLVRDATSRPMLGCILSRLATMSRRCHHVRPFNARRTAPLGCKEKPNVVRWARTRAIRAVLRQRKPTLKERSNRIIKHIAVDTTTEGSLRAVSPASLRVLKVF